MNPAGFNIITATACVAACERSYPEQSISTDLAHCLIVDDAPFADATIIAFRGSQTLRDWFTNFRFVKTDLGYCKIHAGFWAAIRSIVDDIDLPLQKPLIITGHSLGGALAILCATILQKRGHEIADVYTFGAPRVGNAAFALAYRKTVTFNSPKPLSDVTFRLVHEEDIVPRLPPALLGFSHVGAEFFFPSIGPMQIGAPIWFKLASDIVGTWLDFKKGRIAQFADHPVSEYAALLQRPSSQQFGELISLLR